MKSLSMIALLLVLSFSTYAEDKSQLKALTSDENAKSVANMYKTHDAQMYLYQNVLREYNGKFMIASILTACKKEGIAKQIMPSTVDMSLFILTLTLEPGTANQKEQISKLLHGINAEERLNIINSTRLQLFAFYSGMNVLAVRMFNNFQTAKEFKNLCDEALAKADEMLKEKQAKP